MAKDGADTRKLSKNLMRMKFMQRGLDEDERRRLEEEEQRLITDEHWYLDLPDLPRAQTVWVEEPSIAVCEGIEFGRRSFQGFNPEVEKICAALQLKRRGGVASEEEEDQDDQGKDVSDEEMTRRFESVVGSMHRRFQTKRERAMGAGDGCPPIKRAPGPHKFLRPTDD